MRWTPGGSSGDVEDRRGQGGGFGGGGMKMGLGGAAILLVLSLLTGKNFFSVVGAGTDAAPGSGPTTDADGNLVPAATTPEEEKLKDFVTFVLNDAQGAWSTIFQQEGRTYERARLVLFRDATQTACGTGQTGMGPFYCPGDNRIYIDLGFYDELRRRFGAPGDFAQAYVITHELGHHVQRLLGTEARVRQAMERNPDQANALSVRLELQADCYSGVWGHAAAQEKTTDGQPVLEQGDVEEGLTAAAAVGDDRIGQMTGQGVHPEAFTHGSSEQRASWFKRGFQSGNPKDCDTFQQ
ncbi:MAG: zinc metallopeptidase [Gemmatimonadales bacterium]|nr:zinc metallopeptidase [Gemmatimonadales bacterium]